MSFLIIPPFDLDEDGAFERASSATYFDSSGVMRTAAIDEPRFSHNPETLEFEGLLIEGRSENFYTYSEQFDNADWIKENATITANAETAPDGTVTMDKLTYSLGLNGYITRYVNFVAGTPKVISYFAKAAERDNFTTLVSHTPFGGTGGVRYVNFNLTAQTATPSSQGDVFGEIEHVGNGIFRCSATFIPKITVAVGPQIGRSVGVGNGTDGIFIWGAQNEDNELTSYIKTEGTSVTRAADIVPGVVSNVPEDDYPEWDVATGYDLGERVIVISDNGSPEVFYHNVYESLIAGTGTNTGNDPTLDLQWPDGEPVNWILVGSTNRWKMFDDKNSSQTVNADSIDVAITVTSRPTSLFLGNVECQRIEVCQKGADGTIYYQNSFEMIENSGEPSYYNWLFQQIRKRTDLLIGDLVPLSGGTISIRLINTGGTVKCGTCLIGYAEEIGGAQYGAGVGIQDFSVKQQNEFGDYRILERAYSREGDFTVMVDNGNIDRVQNLLASRRAKPTLYIGTELYRCTYIYGFFSDMNNVITYPQQSLLNINIKGLT